MKTAEEIWEETANITNTNVRDRALIAMENYSNQRLINFAKWVLAKKPDDGIWDDGVWLPYNEEDAMQGELWEEALHGYYYYGDSRLPDQTGNFIIIKKPL